MPTKKRHHHQAPPSRFWILLSIIAASFGLLNILEEPFTQIKSSAASCDFDPLPDHATFFNQSWSRPLSFYFDASKPYNPFLLDERLSRLAFLADNEALEDFWTDLQTPESTDPRHLAYLEYLSQSPDLPSLKGQHDAELVAPECTETPLRPGWKLQAESAAALASKINAYPPNLVQTGRLPASFSRLFDGAVETSYRLQTINKMRYGYGRHFFLVEKLPHSKFRILHFYRGTIQAVTASEFEQYFRGKGAHYALESFWSGLILDGPPESFEITFAVQTRDLTAMEKMLNLNPSAANAQSGQDILATPLLTAARDPLGEPALEKLCQTPGIELDAGNAKGETAAYIATLHGHVAHLALLVRYGARLDLATREGITLWMVALSKDHPGLIQFLADQHAKGTAIAADVADPLGHTIADYIESSKYASRIPGFSRLFSRYSYIEKKPIIAEEARNPQPTPTPSGYSL